MHVKDEKVKENLIRRLRRIEGQVRGIQRMIDEERNCQDILQQMSAVRAAMYNASVELVRSYAKECLLDPENGTSPEELVENMIVALGRVSRTVD
ncbi:MAG: transcriptional regulator [Ardenticatenia bacterium]|nr:MAG: transcriptional regulator [Ardenticatenia bacterium]